MTDVGRVGRAWAGYGAVKAGAQLVIGATATRVTVVTAAKVPNLDKGVTTALDER